MMISTAILENVFPRVRISTKRYKSAVSSTPENILPLKKRTISFRIFGLFDSNTQILLVTYANKTDRNHAMMFEMM